MKEFDPKEAKANGFTKDDWDAVDAPEATEEQLAKAKPFKEAHPELAATMEEEVKRRGRPPSENPKVPVSIRLDRDLVEALKAGGQGWQTRVNEALRKSLGI